MNALRTGVRLVLLGLVALSYTQAIAQEMAQTSAVRIDFEDPLEHDASGPLSTEENFAERWSDSDAEQSSSPTAPVDDTSDFEFDQDPTSLAMAQNECCDVDCCFTCNPCPCFYGRIEALFLQRHSQLDNQPIIVDAITGDTLLSTSDINSNYYAGVQATFGMRLCGGRALEFSYFGLFPGGTLASVVRPDASSFLIFPDNLVGNVFVDMDSARVNYSSWLNSFAVNLPCCCGCCDECYDCCDECGDVCGDACGSSEVRCRSVEWFTGFRYLNLGEELDISAQRIVNGGVEDGNYRLRTQNNLYGAQLGARVRQTRGRFGWEAMGAAGIFGNDARGKQSVTDFPDFALRPNVTSSRGGVAFLGEGSLSALYRLTNVWNLRAGYTVIYIGGLALAPDQLDFNFAAVPSGNQLNQGGGLLLHGVTVGLEARW